MRRTGNAKGESRDAWVARPHLLNRLAEYGDTCIFRA